MQLSTFAITVLIARFRLVLFLAQSCPYLVRLKRDAIRTSVTPEVVLLLAISGDLGMRSSTLVITILNDSFRLVLQNSVLTLFDHVIHTCVTLEVVLPSSSSNFQSAHSESRMHGVG